MSSTIDDRRTHAGEPLDGFETALLQELRTVVQDRAGAAPAPGDTRHTAGHSGSAPGAPHRLRRWALPVGVAAAGAAALAIAQPFGGATPAFAVEQGSDGTVTVEINRLDGPEALEAALAEHGITAAVDYPEEGTMCSPDRYVPAAVVPGSMSASTGIAPGEATGESAFSITLDPADYAGRTLVLESTWLDEGSWVVGVGTAEGEVGPCDPVPATGEQFDSSPESEPDTGPRLSSKP